MSSCTSLFDCRGTLFCCDSVCKSSCTDQSFDSMFILSAGVIAGISIGGILLCLCLIGVCVRIIYEGKRSEMNTSVFRGPMFNTPVVTTTTALPSQQRGATAYQTTSQTYPTSGVRGGQVNVYPQTNISSQLPSAGGMSQNNYGISSLASPAEMPETASPNYAGMPQTAPPLYQDTSDPYYNEKPV